MLDATQNYRCSIIMLVITYTELHGLHIITLLANYQSFIQFHGNGKIMGRSTVLSSVISLSNMYKYIQLHVYVCSLMHLLQDGSTNGMYICTCTDVLWCMQIYILTIVSQVFITDTRLATIVLILQQLY